MWVVCNYAMVSNQYFHVQVVWSNRYQVVRPVLSCSPLLSSVSADLWYGPISVLLSLDSLVLHCTLPLHWSNTQWFFTMGLARTQKGPFLVPFLEGNFIKLFVSDSFLASTVSRYLPRWQLLDLTVIGNSLYIINAFKWTIVQSTNDFQICHSFECTCWTCSTTNSNEMNSSNYPEPG